MTPRISLPVPIPFLCILIVLGAALVAATAERTTSSWVAVGPAGVIGASVGLATGLLMRRPAATGVLLVALALSLGIWRAAVGLGGQSQPWEPPTGPVRASIVVESVDERGQF